MKKIEGYRSKKVSKIRRRQKLLFLQSLLKLGYIIKDKSRFLAMLVLGFFCAGAHAQESVTASGGDATGSGGTVAYSIGQVAYTTSKNGSGKISQGVQQAFEISTLGVEDTELNISISVFPNPTADNLTLKIENYKNERLAYQLFDVQGKLIKEGSITDNTTRIALSNLSMAVYFLNVVERNSRLAYKQSFKIIKK